ncbi:hypothetical protein CPB85DRAFT_455491 [Mucidula mucida]|nr:hypothetical protein CPB85DRAFT_455491 [Mucidula mucida]
MAELMTEMARLSAARVHLQRHPCHVKAILHPIRALPQEIIREVFLWSAFSWNDQAMDGIHDSLYHLRPQWVFSQVCRRWRDITLSFPRFWSTLYLNLGGPAYVDPSTVPRSISRLATYLDRSGKQRLDVGIILPSPLLASEFSHLGPVLRASTARWARWKLDASFEFLDIFSSCQFGSLTHLCLDLYPEDPESETKVAFRNTPLLRHVDYRSSVYESMLPWEQLCTLKITELDDSFIKGPLTRLESVQRLQLQLQIQQ